MQTGIELIAAERQRQIEQEGLSAEHDDRHSLGELARAAVCYATPITRRKPVQLFSNGRMYSVPAGWPWHDEWWKPSPDDRICELTKAGALIAAEIDRLQRAKEPPCSQSP